MQSWFGRTLIVVSLALIGIVLVVLVFGQRFLPFAGNWHQPTPQVATTSTDILRENALHGTSSWQIPSGKAASTEIEAYASATSVLPGQTLTFYVSTQKEGTSYSIIIYRLGWYGGLGGRLMTSQGNQIGFAQGYYDPHTHRLVGCGSCRVDKQTGLVEARWLPSYSLNVPSGWPTGVYLAKFTDSNGMQTYAPFDVRGNPHSTYVAVTTDTTYAAYNDWGGYSLYQAIDNLETDGLGRGVKVSFDRPYNRGNGSGDILLFEINAIHWLERQGYDLSYISSIDLHEDPAQLLQHRAYLSLGHDEYWTKEMRDGVEHARDQGVGLAFLGANTAYWQIRLEPDSTGNLDRTVVCYKVLTRQNDLARDPFYGKDNTRVTSQWRDPVVKRPENSMIGIMYSSLTLPQHGFPWRVNPQTTSPLLADTGLQAGHSYGCDIVGNEWDRAFDNGATPARLQILGLSPTVNSAHTDDISLTTYYVASSGAMVFAAGAIYWTKALDNYRFLQEGSCDDQQLVVPGMQKLMVHVMDALVIHHT